jgi:hypothetical protein
MKKTRSINSFIDSGQLTGLFDHVKNLLIFSLLLALGTNDLNQPKSDIFGIFPSNYLGLGVIALASILLLLNLYDGIRRLLEKGHHRFLTAFLILLYIFLTIRVVEVAWYYRLT